MTLWRAGVVACAVAMAGCVPASDRIENRPDMNRPTPRHDQASAAATSGAAPGTAASPTPIRPPTSAIVDPPAPADAAPVDEPATANAPPTDPAPMPQPGRPDPKPDDATHPAPPPTNPTPDAGPGPVPVVEPGPATQSPDEDEAPDDTPEPPLHEAWGPDSAYNALFRPDDLVTLAGDIEAVGTFVPAEGAQPGLKLDLRYGDESVAVHGAPLRYLRTIEVRFDFGERLSVEGSWATIGGKRVLLAQAITRGETRVVLRDAETGRPAWVPAPVPAPDEDPDGPPAAEGTAAN